MRVAAAGGAASAARAVPFLRPDFICMCMRKYCKVQKHDLDGGEAQHAVKSAQRVFKEIQ